MRVAVVSDIHGNAVAFQAVLDDLAGEAIDQVVCLGDAVQGGVEPAAVVARLRELACPVVRGNADEWLLTGVETGAEPPATPWMNAMRAWVLSRLSPADRAFIAGFSPTIRLGLPGGRSLLGFHGSPASFDDQIHPHTSREELRRLLGAHVPALMCGGHTHVQQVHHLGETFYFNPGSVGVAFRHDQPEGAFKTDPWAEYAILTVETAGRVGLEFRRVPFDVERLIAVIAASGAPEPERLIGRYR